MNKKQNFPSRWLFFSFRPCLRPCDLLTTNFVTWGVNAHLLVLTCHLRVRGKRVCDVDLLILWPRIFSSNQLEFAYAELLYIQPLQYPAHIRFSCSPFFPKSQLFWILAYLSIPIAAPSFFASFSQRISTALCALQLVKTMVYPSAQSIRFPSYQPCFYWYILQT